MWLLKIKVSDWSTHPELLRVGHLMRIAGLIILNEVQYRTNERNTLILLFPVVEYFNASLSTFGYRGMKCFHQ